MELQVLINLLQELVPDFEWEDFKQSSVYGDGTRELTKVGVCVDTTAENIHSATKRGVEVLISYHPWHGEASKLISTKEMLIIPLHTAFDNAPEGINFTFAKNLGLQEITLNQGVVTGTISGLIFRELIERCQRIVERNVIPYYGELRYPVRRVGFWSGPGFLPHNKQVWECFLEQGCDTIISGEITLLPLRFASANQLKMVDLGHNGMARSGLANLAEMIKSRLKAYDCSVEFFEHYYAISYHTKNYFMQQNEEIDESLPLFSFAERVE